jgi:small GTP-binding protein
MAVVIQKKLVLLGAPGVGKTSLVRRFVDSLFDDKYLTTIGVKVDKKQVHMNGTDLLMMLWDVAGAEETFSVPSSYVRGAAGILVVVDGTRPQTVGTAADLISQVHRDVGAVPAVVVLNKTDLADQWKLGDAELNAVRGDGRPIVRASAKTGAGVEEAFLAIAAAIVS